MARKYEQELEDWARSINVLTDRWDIPLGKLPAALGVAVAHAMPYATPREQSWALERLKLIESRGEPAPLAAYEQHRHQAQHLDRTFLTGWAQALCLPAPWLGPRLSRPIDERHLRMVLAGTKSSQPMLRRLAQLLLTITRGQYERAHELPPQAQRALRFVAPLVARTQQQARLEQTWRR